MRVRYGSYRLGIAASDISISSDQIPNAMNRPAAAEVIWAVRTRIKNPSGDPRQFPAILNAFERAFSVHGRDIVLEFTDGTPTHHALLTRNCVGGTRVSKFPTYSTGANGQYINYRDVEFEIRGTVPLQANGYLSFTEQISIRGGGARWGCREVNIGPGVRQRLRTNTTCFATQSGSAVGYLARPTPPPPIWPSALVDELPDLTLASPVTQGEGFSAFQTDYSTNWSYQFASPQRLNGIPHFLTGF
jgi:hypothetical protein